MKYVDNMPAGLAASERKLAPGSGLMIAFGVSFAFWALLVWAVL